MSRRRSAPSQTGFNGSMLLGRRAPLKAYVAGLGAMDCTSALR